MPGFHKGEIPGHNIVSFVMKIFFSIKNVRITILVVCCHFVLIKSWANENIFKFNSYNINLLYLTYAWMTPRVCEVLIEFCH